MSIGKTSTASPTSEASHAKDQNTAGRLGHRLRRQEGPGVGERRGREVSQSQDQGSSRASRPEDARVGNRRAGPRLQLGGKRTQLNGADRLARSGGRQVSAQARRAPQRGGECRAGQIADPRRTAARARRAAPNLFPQSARRSARRNRQGSRQASRARGASRGINELAAASA